jgi:FHS family L-fucose permease-like MFS transporter
MKNNNRLKIALILITALFFLSGFSSTLNDILIPYLKDRLYLNYTQIMQIQLCFFFAYFTISPIARIFIDRIGIKRGLILGLILGSCGCFLIFFSAFLEIFNFFLFSLFILGSGVSFLQVAGNPYVILLGDEKTASSRLTFSQTFTCLGMLIAPFLGSFFVLGSDFASTNSLYHIQLPYVLLSIVWIVFAILVKSLNIPDISINKTISKNSSNLKKTHNPKFFIFCVASIFFYVGAEVTIGSFLVKFLENPDIGNLSMCRAARYTTIYWSGLFVGRLLGSILLKKISASKILAWHSMIAIILTLCSISLKGFQVVWFITAIGLCNSIMFPIIFSIGIQFSNSKKGSGYLCMANIGGAIIPMIQGIFADKIGIQNSFIIPACCYLFLLSFSLYAYKKQKDVSLTYETTS